MIVKFQCKKCGKRFKVNVKLAGKEGRCPCGNQIRIPADNVEDRSDSRRSSEAESDADVLENVEISRHDEPIYKKVSRNTNTKRMLHLFYSVFLALIVAIHRAMVDGGITVGVIVAFLFTWGLIYFLISLITARRKRSAPHPYQSSETSSIHVDVMQTRNRDRVASGRKIIILSIGLFFGFTMLQTAGPVGMGIGFVGALISFGIFLFGVFRYASGKMSKR